jgi:P-type conjugative transfer protein TrbJ
MKRAVTLITAAALVVALPFMSSGTGIPVVDVAAIGQAIKSNLEQLRQYALQVQQYQTALNSLKQQLVDAARPELEIYAEAQNTLQSLQQVQAMFQNGSLQGYLQQFGDLNYYRNLPPASYQPLPGNASQKQIDDAWAQNLANQAKNVQSEATQLDRLQQQAQVAQGTRAAIDSANMLASQQARMLLEIQQLMIQEQTALNNRTAAQAALEAQRQAASEKFFEWNYQPSNPVYYKPN